MGVTGGGGFTVSRFLLSFFLFSCKFNNFHKKMYMFSYFLIILITVVFAQKENTSERNEKRVEEVLKQINLQSETGPASFHIFDVTLKPRPNMKFSRFALEHTLEHTHRYPINTYLFSLLWIKHTSN